ncbi:glycosyltransferase family 8 protein [Qingshengfaniella alkalisoli]|uniref:Lipopolysaccharide biosynthesis glycosyltransferase n=1 Tax=Qingshengfaniella alkalisoli TaxID=2599296 RepID=A0A5B8IYD5_9RHOB|nr:glycosyltransferase [Qingshengfaniella alkalisoli]QDY70603.1 hypothetical protein FPZ52_12985 [Qingshengfaniella alkalisoli]
MDPGAIETLRLQSYEALGSTAVFYVADSRYLPLSLASAASAAERLGRKVPVVLLLVDVSADVAHAANDFLRDRGLDAQTRPLDLSAGSIDLSRLATPRESISPAAYGRLAAPDLLTEFETLIYLDGDTLIHGDLAELAAIKPQTLAAVESGAGASRRVYTDNPIATPPSYFNNGVCVINADFWLREKITARIMKLLSPDGPVLSLPDQDVMNLVFGQAYHRLHPRWNFTKGTSWIYTNMQPAIAHFAGRIYPWDSRDRRCPQVYRDRYQELFAQMPAAVREQIDLLKMPPIEVKRSRDWCPLQERLGLRRRSGWNPKHATMLAKTGT